MDFNTPIDPDLLDESSSNKDDYLSFNKIKNI